MSRIGGQVVRWMAAAGLSVVTLGGCTWRGCATDQVVVQITPETPRWGVDALTCTHPLVEATVTWTVDGEPYEGGATVPAAHTIRGRSWTCAVSTEGARGSATVEPVLAQHNVVLVVADDLGTDKVGAYGEHPSPPPTPHLDSLAARGMIFRNAYANPVCSPTRSAYLTGRHASRTGVGQIVDPWKDSFELRDEEVTLPEMLTRGDAAWDSSLAGKWHLASQLTGPPETAALEQGFAWHAGSLGNIRDPIADRMNLPRAKWGYENWPKLQPDGTLTMVQTYATTDTINDAIARVGEMKEPWFLLVSFNAPHAPVHAPPANLHTREGVHPKADQALRFDATVEAMDTEIGRLLNVVDFDDTLVVFYGDNGSPSFGVDPSVEDAKVSSKGSLQEGGINVPLIVAGPLVTEPGSEAAGLVHAVDLFSSVAVMAGVDTTDLGRPIDGVSLLPYLAQPDLPSLRPYAYVEKFRPNGPGPYRMLNRAVVGDRYKLVTRKLPTGRHSIELYDLKGRFDDGENLLGEGGVPLDPALQPVVDQLRAEMQRVQAELVFDTTLPALVAKPR